jgi:cytochrome c556
LNEPFREVQFHRPVRPRATSAVIAQEGGGPPTPEQQAEQAVLTRQGLLKVVGFYMGPLGGMLKNKVPFDAAVAGEERHAHRAVGHHHSRRVCV